MRACTALVLAIGCLIPSRGWAQEKAVAGASAPSAAAARIPDELEARLRAIERRFHDDQRLQRAGTVVGLSAAVVSALSGRRSPAFLGTPALRLGLDRPLTMIRDRSGFAVEPSIGYRSFSITFRRRFD
jgi:hypothetical protein